MFRTAWCQALGRGYGESWQEQSALNCDRSWKDTETQQRFVCAERPGQYFCLLLCLAECLYSPWQCRMRGQYHGTAALPGHEAISKLK